MKIAARPPAVALLAAAALVGCGGKGSTRGDRSAGARPASPPGQRPAHGRTPARAADPAKVTVIRGWVDALRDGHIGRASSYFALPAVVQQTGRPITLRTRAEIRFFNVTLPCGAVLRRAFPAGRYTVAVFALTDRRGPGGKRGCDAATGTLAGTAFLIRAGRIREWRRVVLPSDLAPQSGAGPPA